MSDGIKYFTLPREHSEYLCNVPNPTAGVSRLVDVYLKDGTQHADITVIGNEFYALRERVDRYFEPDEISFVTQA